MENRFYYGLMRLFIATSFVVTTSLTISAQRFETNLVCLSDNGDLARTVKIEPVVKFTIKKDNRYLWAKCEEKKSSVMITATPNTSVNSRSCYFVLLDETDTPVDTLEVIQTGKVSSTVSKVVGSSTIRTKSTTSTRKTSTNSSRSTGGQCAARTKKGTRCSRQASAGSIYCWQHK